MASVNKAVSHIRYSFQRMTHRNEEHVSNFGKPLELDDVEASASTEKSTAEISTQGIDPIVKTYYESPLNMEGIELWVEVPPRQMSKKQAAKLDRIGMKVYQVKDQDMGSVNGKFHLKYHKIELQNLALVAALKPIVQKQGVYLQENEAATFNSPFCALYFSQSEINALYSETPDSSALKQHLLLLLKVMKDIFSGVQKQVKHLRSAGLVTYKLAWTFFKRGTIVYCPSGDVERLVEVLDVKYETKPPHMAIDARDIIFDGSNYTYNKVELAIMQFAGNKPIKRLPVFPLEFHESPDVIDFNLTQRGKRLLNFQSLSYCMCTGVGYHEIGNKVQKYNVNGRILVDTFGYEKHHLAQTRREIGMPFDPDYPIITSEDKKPESEDEVVEITKLFKVEQSANGSNDDDYDNDNDDDDDDEIDIHGEPLNYPRHFSPAVVAAIRAKNVSAPNAYITRLDSEITERNKKIMLARSSELKFINPLLKGYDMKNKVWLKFYVDDVKPMEWNDDAYEHLVFNEVQKDLVYSFVANHQWADNSSVGFTDVIKGKGSGLIILLSGPPGSGKTLMAEAVADKNRSPLLYMHAEDLGVDPGTMGAKLKKMFAMAVDWNAVCLLDECDVFLACRNPVDIHRNELISIFLREIEYFQGILFLTTNLFESIDLAFRSRVSMHLRFEKLGPKSREILWGKFLSRLPPCTWYSATKLQSASGGGGGGGEFFEQHDPGTVVDNTPLKLFKDRDFTELATWELNGREIKAVLKTANFWAAFRQVNLSLEILEASIKVTAPFAIKRQVDMELYD